MTIHFCTGMVAKNNHRIAVCGHACGERGDSLVSPAGLGKGSHLYSLHYFATTCEECMATEVYRNIVLTAELSR